MDIICSFMIIFSTIILPLRHWAGNLGLTPKDRWVTSSTMVSCTFVLRRKATTNGVIDPVDFTDEVLVEQVGSYWSNVCFPTGSALCVSLTDVSGSNNLFIFTLYVCGHMGTCVTLHVCMCKPEDRLWEGFLQHVTSKIRFMSQAWWSALYPRSSPMVCV